MDTPHRETPHRITAQALTPITRLRAILDPRRALLWVYAIRTVLAVALIVALPQLAVGQTPTAVTLVQAAAIMAFAVTGISLIAVEMYRAPASRGFLLAQAVTDIALITALVHVTNGSESQFAALYILVIAYSALLIPRSGGLIAALLVCAFYFTDIVVTRDFILDPTAWLQMANFATVAVGTGYVSARLREVGSGSEVLAETLRRERLQASDVLDNIRSGVVTLDGRGRLRYANQAASALLGVDLFAFVGRPARDELDRAAPGLLLALERAIRTRTRTSRAEAVVQGEERELLLGITVTFLRRDDGEDAGSATAIFSDISDQKKLEDLHLRAGQLEAVSELAASLAHEIKNPLASIRSAVEQLGRMPSADEDTGALTRLVVRESDRLARLLTEFLDFARVRVTQVEPVDLAALVRDIVNLVAAHPDRSVRTQLVFESDADEQRMDGDSDLLHRAIFNLVLNAAQAVDGAGTVRVVLQAATVDTVPGGVLPDGGALRLMIEDDGPGMTDEVREKIFTPFFTTKPRGSGLGLPVVHRAIEAHRGVVLVDSSPGSGTRFTIILPRTQSDPGAPA
ncbi:MAG: PAS domain-containing protein [Gemmatimonadaceae bacterium]|nr:PAS domain-containing protein [Gemmatimonadaceae bacterium]